MGSHDISTTSVLSLVVVISSLPSSPVALIAGRELAALGPPLRLLVHGLLGHLAQPAYGLAVDQAASRRQLRPGWLVHERHELVGEAWHRASDADAAHVGAAADPVDPATLRDVAHHDRSPAAELDDAGRLPVGVGELALLVVAGAV